MRLPSDSLASESSARMPAATSASYTLFPYVRNFSLTGRTVACTGASQTGNAPAKCSMMTEMNRSMRSRDRAVDHDQAFFFSLFVHEERSKRSGRIEIALDGGELPLAADCILEHKVELWSVERRFAFDAVDREVHPSFAAPSSALSAACQFSSVPRYFERSSPDVTERLTQ